MNPSVHLLHGDEGVRAPLVAVVFCDESPEGGSADVPAAVHDLHALSRRVLLIGRGEWSKEHPAVAAMRTGQVDVRHGSIRRVAVAVGGGTIAVQLVHLRLAELESGC